MKDDILKSIIDFYRNSKSFNGLPIYKMENYNFEMLVQLIDEDMITAYSDKDCLNPHVSNCFIKIPKENQKKAVSCVNNYTVLYPTKLALSNIDTNISMPFTAMMQKGFTHFDICYFNIEILERYIANPKFSVFDHGYRGSIAVKDEYIKDDLECEYIKNWGMAYKRAGDQLVRAVGAFVSDLTNLDESKQALWKSYMLNKQEDYIVSNGFITNLVIGDWVTDVWIFDALIAEMNIINEQSIAMGIPPLFKRVFESYSLDKPDGYRNIFLPTLSNYNNFVMTLEKMLVNNISVQAFQKDSLAIKSIERKYVSGENKDRDKGSLVMLEEWLSANINTDNEIISSIVNPLKRIRKLRQKPAHDITKNEYSYEYYDKQRELMDDTYCAIRNLRLLFSNHPLAKSVNIPEYLISGENIVHY